MGQLPLAYLTAVTHGLTEVAETLAAQLQAAGLPLPAPISAAASKATRREVQRFIRN